jgi:hypothetical protein
VGNGRGGISGTGKHLFQPRQPAGAARAKGRSLIRQAAAWAVGRLSAGRDGDISDVVLVVDETADEKSSDGCVGAACQYSGTVGGTALCQVAVTLTVAARAGHALIGRALYLPRGLGRRRGAP